MNGERARRDQPATADDATAEATLRRRRVAVAVGLALVGAAVVVVLLLEGGDDDTSGIAGATTAATATAEVGPAPVPTDAAVTDGSVTTSPQSVAPSSTATTSDASSTTTAPTPSTTPAGDGGQATEPAPPVATVDIDAAPPTLPPVPLDEPAPVGNGIVAAIARIEAIEGTATGPGNIAGPALRLTIQIDNGTADAVALDGVAVNVSHGADRTPAPPLDDPSQRAFAGTVEPGASATGVYVFSVPLDVRDLVNVEVGYAAGAPLLLFSGPAG